MASKKADKGTATAVALHAYFSEHGKRDPQAQAVADSLADEHGWRDDDGNVTVPESGDDNGDSGDSGGGETPA